MNDATRWTTSLREGSRVLMLRGFAVVLELRRDGVVLRPSGGEPDLVPWAQLGQVTATTGDTVAAVHRAMRPEWDRLSLETRQDALDRLEVVQEIITGFREGHPEFARPGEPFTPYGPTFGLSESERAEEMARDLTQAKSADRALLRRRLARGLTDPPAVAVSTVRSWLTRWRKGGLLDLVDRRKDRSDEWLARLPVEFHQAAEAEVARLDGDISSVHIAEIHRRTLLRLQGQGYTEGLPSAKVARRLYSQLLAGRGRTTRSHRAYAVRRASSTRSGNDSLIWPHQGGPVWPHLLLVSVWCDGLIWPHCATRRGGCDGLIWPHLHAARDVVGERAGGPGDGEVESGSVRGDPAGQAAG